MDPYRRPAIEEPVVVDAAGDPIRYGDRWGHGPPPDESYGRDSHPERFAPLHAVADALIAHLVAAFDVERREGPTSGAVLRATSLVPSDPAAATLTFVFSSYPCVTLAAGVAHEFPFPACGCDACDATWSGEAEDLEWHVFAVVSGGYREFVQPLRGWKGCALESADGRREHRSRLDPRDRRTAVAAARRLRRQRDGWAPWPRRRPA